MQDDDIKGKAGSDFHPHSPASRKRTWVRPSIKQVKVQITAGGNGSTDDGLGGYAS